MDGGAETTPSPDPSPHPAPPRERRPIVRSLLSYVRHPRSVEPHDGSPRWVASLKLLGLDFLLLIPLSGVAALGEAGVSGESYTADDGVSAIGLLLIGVVFAPLLEETTFRLALTRFAPGLVAASGVLMVLTVLDVPLGLGIALAVPSVGLVVLAVVAGRSDRMGAAVSSWWDRRFAFVFFGSAAIFGLIHIANYDFASPGALDVALAPLLIAPQMVGGVILGYVRVRLGFWYAVANHAAFNAVLWVLDTVPG